MLQLIVCDWNGTLFKDPLEEQFFSGLCKLAFWRTLRTRSLRKLSALLVSGLKCYREYLSAKGRGDKTIKHISNLVEMLNPCVFAGISRDELIQYTASYAKSIQKNMDMRLIVPIKQLALPADIPIAVISSGSREGIMPSLELVGLEMEEVKANRFIFDDEDVTEGFDFSIRHNKVELLEEILEQRKIDPRHVMYIGDAQADEGCFRMVGYPVVSFFAMAGFRLRVNRLGIANSPNDQDEFTNYLQEAIESK